MIFYKITFGITFNLSYMKIRLLIFLSASFLYFHNTIAQSNEKMILPAECGKYVKHVDGCTTFVPNEVIGTTPDLQAAPQGGCPYRPYREMVAYDETLLNTYSKDSIETWIRRAYDRFERTMNNSGLTHGGVRLIKIMPVKVEQNYTNLDELSNFARNFIDGVMDSLPIIKNELLDCDHTLLISKEGITTALGLGINLQMTNNPNFFLDNKWKKKFGAINLVTISTNALISYAHECGHGVGADHENPYASSVTPTYARSYVDPIKGVSDIMKGATIASWVVEVFSGPNSKTVKNGNTITVGSDTVNNAKSVQEVLDVLMCATEQIVTRVSIQPTTCGSGILHAITNNADRFAWKVITGTCTLGNTNKQDISYMASSTTTIQVIGWKHRKWYADTAYITIPAIEMSTTKATIQSGTYYILPSGDTITMNGTYTSTLKNRNGCDSIVTTVLTVITNTADNKPDELSIIPNPSFSLFRINGILDDNQVLIFDLMGHPIEIKRTQDQFDLSTHAPGIYYICISRGQHITYHKLLKL